MGISIALPLLAILATPQSKPAAPAQQPVARWIVEYADNSCLVARQFGAPGNPVNLSFKLLPGRSSNQLVIEELVEGKAAYLEAPLTITAYPGEHKFQLHGRSGSAKSGSRLLYSALDQDKLALLEQAEEISIDHPGWNLRLATRGLKGATAAATACEDDLLRSWGIDAAGFRAIAVPAKPKSSPGSWVTNDDYPPESLRASERGIVGIRLDIAATGKVTKCTVIASSKFGRLDDHTCRIVRARADYTPAQSADGASIPSIALFSYRWQVWP